MPPRHQYQIQNRIVSRATYYRHLQRNRNVILSETSGSDGSTLSLSPSSSSPSSIAPMTALGSLGSPSEVMEGIASNVPPILSPQRETGESEFHMEEVDMRTRVGFVDGRIPHYPLQEPDVRQSIQTEVLGLQADLDAANVPIAMQEKILQRLFKRKNEVQHGNVPAYSGMGIGQLMNITESNSLEYFAPSSWDEIEKFYKDHGMTSPVRYRLCTGKEGISHPPILMQPSNEDFYEGPNVVKCTCGMDNTPKLARDCANCCTKCPDCGIQRKDIMAFDYLPFGSRIAFMCKSRTICYDFLEIWRKRNQWLGRELHHQPPSISQFWHGKKMREVQDFWNPEKHWELPIRCSGPNCNFKFRAFPTKCIELQRGWNGDLKKYQFPCPHCDFNIDESPSLIQGDPRNFAIAAHWDGFQAATTKYKDCWAVEIEILNGGIENLIRPMPILFIPASSEKILKDIEEQVMTVFLEPFIKELESVFIHGFNVHYNFPSEDISLNLRPASGIENFKARAMLMYWTGSGEMLDDVIRHGPHDLYWCYRFERNVSSYKSIKTNQKQSEITYSKYEIRVAYTSVQEKILMDKDSLYPPQRAVLEIHKQLLTAQHRPGGTKGMDQHVCPPSHAKGIILTNTIKHAKSLEKLQTLLPQCACQEIIQSKGISVGWRSGNMHQMSTSVETYLRKYWREEGILNDITEENFSNEIEKISFVIFRGVHYRVGDHVIAREDGHELDPLHELGYYTYKAKITMLFIHDCMGHYRLFFHAKFFRQIPSTSSSSIPMLSDFSSMVLVTSPPRFFIGDDCRPIHVLLHKFMDQPIPGRTDAIVALELADVAVRKHLVKMGEPGYCPPWPQVSDIMYCCQNQEEPSRVDIVVVRQVMLPPHLGNGGNSENMDADEPYVGHVLVNVLELQNRERGTYKVTTGSDGFQCSWKCLIGHVEESGFPIAFDRIHNAPIRWQGIQVVSNYRRGILMH